MLMENWRGFLNEKLMLKPGPDGWDLYSELIAEAYLAAPTFEERAVPAKTPGSFKFPRLMPIILCLITRLT